MSTNKAVTLPKCYLSNLPRRIPPINHWHSYGYVYLDNCCMGEGGSRSWEGSSPSILSHSI